MSLHADEGQSLTVEQDTSDLDSVESGQRKKFCSKSQRSRKTVIFAFDTFA